MAARRMFALQVVDTDAFLDLSIPSQCLYFHLCLHADDDGMVGSPRKIVRVLGCSEENLAELSQQGFIIQLQEGVVAIRHWKINNLIRHDRYNPTIYQSQLSCLTDTDGVYNLIPDGLPFGNQMGDKRETQERKGEFKQDKSNESSRGDQTGSQVTKEECEHALLNSGLPEEVKNSLRMWVKYKSERKEGYKLQGFKSLISVTEKKVQIFGESKVCDLIEESMASGWKGIIWKNLDNLKADEKEYEKNGPTGDIYFE